MAPARCAPRTSWPSSSGAGSRTGCEPASTRSGGVLTGAWDLLHQEGPAGQLHGELLPVPDRRLVRVAAVDGPALVLGSTQLPGRVDQELAESLGIEVAQRRSGGGAVLLWPGHQVWLDVGLPRTDPLWDDDVAASSRWLGAALVAALEELGVPRPAAHAGPMERTAWSHLVCFAGRAPGEVLVGERKVVGTSQRRTREGAVFQVAVALVWAPGILVDVLRLPVEAAAAISAAGVGLSELVPAVRQGDVVDAVVAALPT